VWVEQGPLAILAVAIRGTAPLELREVIQETLERIHLQYGQALKNFAGDAAVFADTEPLLEECLQSGYDVENQPASSARTLSPFRIIVGVILMALLVAGFFWLRDRRRWNAYVEKLRGEPGIVVTDEGRQGGKYFVSGLRDPLARDPKTVMQGTGVEAESVVGRWQAFQSLTPDFVLARARSSLAPPASIKLIVHDGVLEADGFASHQWIVETRRIVRLLPGVSQFQEDKLLDLDRIENPLLMFEFDQTQLKPNQENTFNQLVSDIQRLQQFAGQQSVQLEITGRADSSGTEERNAALSQGRADTVADMLKRNLPAPTNLTITTVGSKEKLRDERTEADRAMNRSVTLKVIVSDTP